MIFTNMFRGFFEAIAQLTEEDKVRLVWKEQFNIDYDEVMNNMEEINKLISDLV